MSEERDECSDHEEFYDALGEEGVDVNADVDTIKLCNVKEKESTSEGGAEAENGEEMLQQRSRQEKLAFARRLMASESRDEENANADDEKAEDEEIEDDDVRKGLTEELDVLSSSLPDVLTPTSSPTTGAAPNFVAVVSTPASEAQLSFLSAATSTPLDAEALSSPASISTALEDVIEASPPESPPSNFPQCPPPAPPPPDLVLSTRQSAPSTSLRSQTPRGDAEVLIGTTPVAPPRRSKREKRLNGGGNAALSDKSRKSADEQLVVHAVDDERLRVTETDTESRPKSIGVGLEHLLQPQQQQQPKRGKPSRPSQPPPPSAAPKGEEAVRHAAMHGMSTTGSELTDAEIGAIPLFRDIDTGEMIPLSEIDKRLSADQNPLSQLIQERADDFGDSDDSDCGSVSTVSSGGTTTTTASTRAFKWRVVESVAGGAAKPPRPPPPSINVEADQKKTKGVKQFFGDLTDKIKKPRGGDASSQSATPSVATSVDRQPLAEENRNGNNHHGKKRKSQTGSSGGQQQQQQANQNKLLGMPVPKKGIEVRVEVKHRSSHVNFPNLHEVQTLGNRGSHGATGPVWAMKFSHCGRLLATGGQDNILRIWVLRDSFPYFDEMKQRFNQDNRQSPSASHVSLASLTEEMKQLEMGLGAEAASFGGLDLVDEDEECVFMPKAFVEYRGHGADLLDISWSKNYFLLSASMDKTVRLWHVSRKECLCCFQHVDFVTAIAFHPKDDRYFLSGSLDGKLRLWNIPDKKVALWNEVEGQRRLITTANFCDSGKLCVVGTYDGRCVFYTDQLKYHTVIHVKSTRGKNKGKKITGIVSMPGDDKKVLVSSNDSRVRLYDLNDASLTCKFKGATNLSSQIKASFSPSGRYVISGSEDKGVYIWKTFNEVYKLASAARRDKNDYFEVIRSHADVVTCAVFAPHPILLIKAAVDACVEDDPHDPLAAFDDAANAAAEPSNHRTKSATAGSGDSKGSSLDRREEFGDALVTADFKGTMKVFIHPRKPITETIKRSSLMR